MFSIIIPLYNKAPYVEKAINSILTQSYKEFELIIMNDGSTDNSLEVVNSIDFFGIDVKIISQKNQGVSITRNNGVKIASQDYVCFLDADDWWENNFLEEMNKLVHLYPDAGIYGSGYYIVKNEKKRIAPIGIDENFKHGEINYFQIYSKTLCMPLWTGSVVISKDIFKYNKGFKPALKLGEDFDLWVRIALEYPVVFLNKPLSNYNQDVDLNNRAVGGKFYKPEEHMLFTDYGRMMKNEDFRYLFERLSLYSLIPYYLSGTNKLEVKSILKKINWTSHELKYKMYYKIMPKSCLKIWLNFLKTGVSFKRKLFS